MKNPGGQRATALLQKAEHLLLEREGEIDEQIFQGPGKKRVSPLPDGSKRAFHEKDTQRGGVKSAPRMVIYQGFVGTRAISTFRTGRRWSHTGASGVPLELWGHDAGVLEDYSC